MRPLPIFLELILERIRRSVKLSEPLKVKSGCRLPCIHFIDRNYYELSAICKTATAVVNLVQHAFTGSVRTTD